MSFEEMEHHNLPEPEIKLQKASSSTPKDGISTWILLSDSETATVSSLSSSASATDQRGPIYRIENNQKLDKVAKIIDTPSQKQSLVVAPTKKRTVSTTVKPMQKRTQGTTTNAPANEEAKPVENKLMTRVKASVVNNAIKKKNAEDLINKNENDIAPTKKTKRPTGSTTPTTTTMPTTTEADIANETESPNNEIETSTFLILEPKDADFDLPQDRSPGPVTKKPKRPSDTKNTKPYKKKNNSNTGATNTSNKKKKPLNKLDEVELISGSTPAVQKDKPMSTKIYNFISREVMPTVGVGLVGLVVTAGIASYFLGPFGALRRSYDVADRKDDLYYYNNEEYAGPDGQSEEEMFGKVIAGMPTSSLYRSNIRQQNYQNYRPNPNQVYNGPNYQGQYQGAYKYPPPSPYSRYRNIGPMANRPPGYGPGTAPVNPGIQSRFGAQIQREQQSIEAVNNNSNNNNKMLQASVENETLLKDKVDTVSVDVQQGYMSAPTSVNNEQQDQIIDADALQHRTQFVVGSIVPDNVAESAVPEHGPRRRRNAAATIETKKSNENSKVTESSKSIKDNQIDDNENEVYDDNVDRIDKTTKGPNAIKKGNKNTLILSTQKPKDTVINDNNHYEFDDVASTTISPGQTNIFDFIRRIFELKVRFGLSFLQNATNAFQRYLRGVEDRVEKTDIFKPSGQSTIPS